MTPLRVLSISTLFPRDGKPGFGGFVARQFDAVAADEQVDLTVVSPVVREKAAGPVRAYPVHYVRFNAIPKIGARWSSARIARAVLPLARQLHHEQPFDLIDAQFFFPDGPAAAQIAAALELPLSIKARGSDINFWGKRGFARDMMLAASHQASGLLAVSEALKSEMVGLGMEADKIAVHYTGLDHALFHPRDRAALGRELFPFDPDKTLLISPGNLVPVKGHDLAIAALAHLDGAHLVIAGRGPLEPSLRKQAQSLGLSDKVLFASYSPEQIALALAAADALVLASENEGLANVWIEALASGTPLVIPDVGGGREVVTSPGAGRIVERNPEAIAKGAADLLANPPGQAEVAAHAAGFSWDRNGSELAEFWRRCSARA